MLKKFVEYAIGNFLALLLGFISSPIITRIIAPEEMGKFSLFNTMTSLLFLVIMVGTNQHMLGIIMVKIRWEKWSPTFMLLVFPWSLEL